MWALPYPVGHTSWKHLSSVTSVISDSLRPHGLAPQAPLPRGFSRQEYWSVLPRPSLREPSQPRDGTLESPALAGRFFTTSAAWKALEALKGPYSGTSGYNLQFTYEGLTAP